MMQHAFIWILINISRSAGDISGSDSLPEGQPKIEIKHAFTGATVFTRNSNTLQQGTVVRNITPELSASKIFDRYGQEKRSEDDLTFHESPYTIVFSPIQKVLTISDDCTVKLWEIATGDCVKTLEDFQYSDIYLVSSPDGTKILSFHVHTFIAELWDVVTGDSVQTFHVQNIVEYATFSPDGTKLLTASCDYPAKLWVIDTGACLQDFEGTEETHLATFSPDGTKVLLGSGYTVIIWDVTNGSRVRTFKVNESDDVIAAFFSPNGAKVIFESPNKSSKLWDVETGSCIQIFTGYDENVEDATFSPDGTQILISTGHNAKLWNVENKACIQTFRHHGTVFSATFSLSGKEILTASYDNTARLWNAENGACIQIFEGHHDSVKSATFSTSG